MYYRSISPSTKSWVPIDVTESAKYNPLTESFNPCKCKKPGAFVRRLKGLLVPFDTNNIPNHP
jgi:hypothetical protein